MFTHPLNENNRCNMKYLICLAALLWAGMKLTAADNVKEVEIK